jgi:hypothetical protein
MLGGFLGIVSTSPRVGADSGHERTPPILLSPAFASSLRSENACELELQNTIDNFWTLDRCRGDLRVRAAVEISDLFGCEPIVRVCQPKSGIRKFAVHRLKLHVASSVVVVVVVVVEERSSSGFIVG